eukprot:gnl/MRDRNA2_/MRDRNA2_77815_c0_seq1.p2 gnl/MRDRNA2_/MRDRNA2_77815_c0~~gnl/MRDRNA2_/MRDRNA2_77815_c0_seq1.p2  ORF type:complete len:106 (+),score=11.48 gnl/MRDRNA2_/MRDRNA2_77815_c0_seq1:155-472(+)
MCARAFCIPIGAAIMANIAPRAFEPEANTITVSASVVAHSYTYIDGAKIPQKRKNFAKTLQTRKLAKNAQSCKNIQKYPQMSKHVAETSQKNRKTSQKNSKIFER